jgi:hypothetical protein
MFVWRRKIDAVGTSSDPQRAKLIHAKGKAQAGIAGRSRLLQGLAEAVFL